MKGGMIMPWQIIVFSRVIIAHVLTPALLKRMAGLNLSLKRLVWWQFMFCFAFSVIYAIISGFTFKSELWMVAGIGFFNSLGAYCQWQAIKISLSKTAMFTQADDFIGILLGYIFLNEAQFLNPGLLIGMCFCFAAALILVSVQSNLRLIKYVLIYSVIWGVATFLERYFAITGISFSQFLVSWYGGSLLGISCVLLFLKEEGITLKVPKKEVMAMGILAIAIWFSMVLGYWGAKLAPITVFQPIFLVSEAVLPTIIGFLMFKEVKVLSNKEKFAFAFGLIGVIAIALSFR